MKIRKSHLAILSAVLLTSCSSTPDLAILESAQNLAFWNRAPATTLEATGNAWFKDGQATLTDRIAMSRDNGRAKNVILFVGDGMGISTITAARIYDGQAKGMTGEENSLSFDRFPNVALVKTYNTDTQVPDSAGTATAMHSGVKTRAGVIGIDGSAHRQNCKEAAAAVVPSLADYAERSGKATGVVTTTRVTHATPSTTYAHSPERNWEHSGELPAEAAANGCVDIARQLIEFNEGDGLEVVLGGGKRGFFGKNAKGRRANADDDLVSEWQAKGSRRKAFVGTGAELKATNPQNVDQLFGLFSSSHMTYMVDKKPDNEEPTLSEMTAKAIDILSKDEDGFYLLVEGGRIDHGHHQNVAERALGEAQEFSKAVAVALSKVNLSETLILVTADHSHVFTMAGYPTRGNPILGLVVGNDDTGESTGKPKIALDGQPYTTVGYTNGPGAVRGKRPHPHENLKAGKPLMQQSLVWAGYSGDEGIWPSETHGGEDVALFAIGPRSHLVGGVVEQNVIFHIIAHAYGWKME